MATGPKPIANEHRPYANNQASRELQNRIYNMQMNRIFFCPLSFVLAAATLIGTSGSCLAESKVFTACIGDICKANVPGSADYIYRCDFAKAHPSDTDEAAAKQICTVDEDYSNYSYSRYS